MYETAHGASHGIKAMNPSSENEMWEEVISAANDAALQIISLYNHKGSCSNTELAYCITLTVPIPVVEGEQSELFQNWKLLKNILGKIWPKTDKVDWFLRSLRMK